MKYTTSTLWATMAVLALFACQGEETSLMGVRSGGDLVPAVAETCFGMVPTHVLIPGGKGTNGKWFKGTSGDDVILGTEGNDMINGLGGNDLICGLGGDDDLRGGDGDDQIDGGDGADVIRGQGGADLLYGGAGNDDFWGGLGDDGIWGGDDDDTILGEGGADSLFGGDGNDRIQGSGWRGVDDGDRLYGEGGDDNLQGGPGDDIIEGGAGADWLFGQGGTDALDGGDDNDLCRGGGEIGDTLVNCETLSFVLFLHNRSTQPSTATTSLANLPMDNTVPTNAGALPNYDTDRDGATGRLIQKDSESATQSDLGKYQNWVTTLSVPMVIEKANSAELRIWMAMKDLNSSKTGRVRVYIRDCPGTPQTGCTVIGQADFVRPNGAAFSQAVIAVPWTFAGTTRIIASGRRLEVKVVVRSSSDDDMWFGYDTAAQQSQLFYVSF